MKLNASTKSLAVYTHDLTHESVLSLEYELHIKNDATVKKVSIYRYDKLYSILHTFKVQRACSSIKTPESTIVQNAD